MPFYVYVCPDHGAFDKRAGYDDAALPCECGALAPRQPVYPLSFVMEGKSMPRRDDTASVQEEMGKELRKRNWSGDRAIDGLRRTKFTDETGHLRVDTTKMPQTA